MYFPSSGCRTDASTICFGIVGSPNYNVYTISLMQCVYVDFCFQISLTLMWHPCECRKLKCGRVFVLLLTLYVYLYCIFISSSMLFLFFLLVLIEIMFHLLYFTRFFIFPSVFDVFKFDQFRPNGLLVL